MTHPHSESDDYDGTARDDYGRPHKAEPEGLELTVLGTFDANHDDDGGFTRYTVLTVPMFTPTAEVKAAVADKFPSEHCKHSYDCCANTYARTASYDLVRVVGESALIMVRQGFMVNI